MKHTQILLQIVSYLKDCSIIKTGDGENKIFEIITGISEEKYPSSSSLNSWLKESSKINIKNKTPITKEKRIQYIDDKDLKQKILDIKIEGFKEIKPEKPQVGYNIQYFIDNYQLQITEYDTDTTESFLDIKSFDERKEEIKLEGNNGQFKELKISYPDEGNFYLINKSKNIIIKIERETIDIKKEICKNLQIDKKIWNSKSNEECIGYIRKSIENKLNIKNVELDFSPLIKELETKNIENITNVEDIIEKHNNNEKNLLQEIPKEEWKSYSQLLIVKLLDIYYNKGYYQLAVDKIFKNEILEPSIYEELIVKKAYAHCLGSLEVSDYHKAYDFLKKIAKVYKNANEGKEYIDLMTAAISNYRRFNFYARDREDNLNLNKLQNILIELIESYFEIFIYNDEYNYYSGINLAYLIKIYQNLNYHINDLINKYDYTNQQEKELFNILVRNINKIFEKSKVSIEEDKKLDSAKHWASVSEIEFKILSFLEQNEDGEKLIAYFEENNISIDFKTKVLRQFKFYNDLIKYKTDFKNDILYKFYKMLIEIVENPIQ